MSSKRSSIAVWKNSLTKIQQPVLDKAFSITTQTKVIDIFART